MLTIVEAENSTVSPEMVGEIIKSTKPSLVRADEIKAGPVHAISQGDEQYVRLQRGEPAFAVIEEGAKLLVRLEHVLNCAPSEEQLNEYAATTISVAHIVEFDVIDEVQATTHAVSAFVETNAYFVAYPYVRQLFTTLTAELGLIPVVLDYMQREEWPFSTDEVNANEPSDVHS